MKKLLSTASAVAIAGSMMLGFSTAATADQVFNDDVIITFSLCVGNDCVNGESFGFDTIRLKENNLRIAFVDTSTSASFPTNDWEIEVNSSNNGGENYFAIDDVSGGRTPFRVQAGAPTGSLWVDSAGDVGIGQQNPVVDLHVTSGNTPTLRLEQNGTSGFASQTFDVAANEANFFVRDVTNSSRLSFRIRPGAPESSIDIASDGDVGVGTSSPQAALHVRRTNGSAQLLIEDTSSSFAVGARIVSGNTPRIEFDDSRTGSAGSNNAEWHIGMNGNEDFIFRSLENTVNVATFEHGGDLRITGQLYTGGTTCGTGCDLVFTDDFELPTIEEHAAEMWSRGYLPNVGPTIENEAFNLTQMVGGMLNELETAHIYIEQLNNRIAELEAQQQN